MAVACVVTAGCFGGGMFTAMDLRAGAQQIYSQDNTCPIDRTVVRARPDIAPHTLVAQTAQPPSDVAADPGRLQMWQTQQAQQQGALDSAYQSFEATGCGNDTMYVCTHPSRADVATQNGRIVSNPSYTMRSGDTVMSAVACVAAQNLPASAGMGDIAARLNAPDVLALPATSPLPAIPPALRGYKVVFTGQTVGADSALESAAQSNAACNASATTLASALGWTPVFDASAPRDLIVQSDCTASADFTTATNGMLYVLLPVAAQGMTLATPDGHVIDTIPPPAKTMRCPTTDQGQCGEALTEYVRAYVVGAVAGSQKLAAFAAQHPAQP
ncbi:MAG TPA: hypothetical protein VGG74_32570 [Kofleriaceae bacterium]